jgi:hypothetical protein
MRKKISKRSINSGLQALLLHVAEADDAWQIVGHWHLNKGLRNIWASTGDDDRSKVIIVSTLLEQALETAIATHFVVDATQSRGFFAGPIDGNSLGFATKIQLAFALGVNDGSIRNEFTLLKNIRNVFAHTRARASFSHRAIRDACDGLIVPQLIRWGGVLGPVPNGPKEKFAASCRFLYLYLSLANDPADYDGSEGERRPKAPMFYASSKTYNAFLLAKHRDEPRTSGERLAKALLDYNPDKSLKQ